MDETIIQSEGGCILLILLPQREASDSKMRVWRRCFSFSFGHGKACKIAKK